MTVPGSTTPAGKAVLRQVPLSLMRVNSNAQRELNPNWVRKLAENLDPVRMGALTLNKRGDLYYIVDGQHRAAAYKSWLGDGQWQARHLDCWVYEELSDEEEAGLFLLLNNRLKPGSFDAFHVAAQAGYPAETEICQIAEDLGLTITRGKTGIRAVSTLMRVYQRSGPTVLRRTLTIIRDSYGITGFDAPIIEGISLFCQRYGAQVADDFVIRRLQAGMGGSHGLLNSANQIRQLVGQQKSQCVAAAVTQQVNRGRKGRKLTNWWTSAPQATSR